MDKRVPLPDVDVDSGQLCDGNLAGGLVELARPRTAWAARADRAGRAAGTACHGNVAGVGRRRCDRLGHGLVRSSDGLFVAVFSCGNGDELVFTIKPVLPKTAKLGIHF